MDLAANEKAVHSDFFNGEPQFSFCPSLKYDIFICQVLCKYSLCVDNREEEAWTET